MSSLQQGNRFLLFSKNNIQRKQLSMQGGLPQSLSGSDTDISTSNENLSNEEKYVIRHTARQEPQGQENHQQSPSRSSSHKENIPNIQGNLPLANRNSLKDNLNGSNRNSLKESLNGSNRNSLKDSINGSNRNSLKDNQSNRTSLGSNRSSLDISASSYNTLIIHNDESSWMPSGRLPPGIIREHGDTGSYLYRDIGGKGHSNSPTMQSLSNLQQEDYIHEQLHSSGNSGCVGYGGSDGSGCQEITDIPDDDVKEFRVLKHLVKEVVKVPSYDNSGSRRIRDNKGFDIDYRGKSNEDESEDRSSSFYISTLWPLNKPKHRLLGPTEKLTMSRSQPELSRINKADTENYNLRMTCPRPQTKGREEIGRAERTEIWPRAEMIQIIIEENSALKLELERCYKKVFKSQKLEQEIGKVHRAHEELEATCERREKLERAARARLQSDCRRLMELNRSLKDRLDLLSMHTDNPALMELMRKELTQRDLLIGRFLSENKELIAAKERQEIELAAQRATLQEQRTHIDILDTALTNAQSNVVRLEDECRKKQVYVERVGQLQEAVSLLQASSDRREATERHLRVQLERELRESGVGDDDGSGGIGGSGNGGDDGGGGDEDDDDDGVSGNDSRKARNVADLKRRLRERDEKIMLLAGEVAKWEQRYLEENALRQAAIEAASLPKDAKIAALEKTTQDAEKLIAEARLEKIRHMDEIHVAHKKLADLESRMKDSESKLAERDAMIRVLQKHHTTYTDKDSSISSGVSSYPAGHSSHSSTSVDHHTALITSTPELVSSVLHGGSGYGSTASYGVRTDCYKYRKQTNFEETNKTLDDQLKELDSQLLSKRALCCFPGFSNPGATSRKGKIPKPLLASVDNTGIRSSSTASSKSRLMDDSSDREISSPSIIEFANAAARLKGTISRGLSEGKPEEIMLLEKQGRSSQRQRMQQQQQQQQQQNNGEPRRAGSLPPSSLPRPPRTFKSSSNSRYCRLSDTETRKKSDPGPILDSNITTTTRSIKAPSRGCVDCTVEYGRLDVPPKMQRKKKCIETLVKASNKSVATLAVGGGVMREEYERLSGDRGSKKSSSSGSINTATEIKHQYSNRELVQRVGSLIPPPPSSSRRTAVGEYGRLSDGDSAIKSSSTLRMMGITRRGQSTGSTVSSKSGGGGRDSGGTTVSSEASTISLPPLIKGRSIPRPTNYRIQF